MRKKLEDSGTLQGAVVLLRVVVTDLLGLLEEAGRAQPLSEGVLLLDDPVLALHALVAADVDGVATCTTWLHESLDPTASCGS